MFINAVQEDPNNTPMRQIPIVNENWSSSLWISENGIIRRRFFNIFNNTWNWSHEINPIINDDGDVLISVANRKISLEHAVASAWLPNTKNRKHVKYRNESNIDILSNVYWTDESSDEVELMETDDEKWVKLKYSNFTCVPKCEYSYWISSHGRVKNTIGEVTCGTYINNCEVLCLDNGVVINIKESQKKSFGKKCMPNTPKPRIKKMIEVLTKKLALQEYSDQSGLQMSTIWTYVYDAIRFMSLDQAKIVVKHYVSTSAWNAIHTIFEYEHEHIFSLPSKEYMKAIDSILCDDPNWKCNPHRYAEVRILKLFCQMLVL